MCIMLIYLVGEAVEDLKAPLVALAAGRLVEGKVGVKPRPDKPLHCQLAYPVPTFHYAYIIYLLEVLLNFF